MAESEISGQNEAVYIAMQPGEMEGQVEVQDCQEVVIVAEGGDDESGGQESVQFGESQVVAVGAQEVYEEAFVSIPKEEKPSYKHLPQHIKYSSANRYSYPSYSNVNFDLRTEIRSLPGLLCTLMPQGFSTQIQPFPFPAIGMRPFFMGILL